MTLHIPPLSPPTLSLSFLTCNVWGWLCPSAQVTARITGCQESTLEIMKSLLVTWAFLFQREAGGHLCGPLGALPVISQTKQAVLPVSSAAACLSQDAQGPREDGAAAMQRRHGWLSSRGSPSATNSRPLDLGIRDSGGKPAVVYPSGHSPRGKLWASVEKRKFYNSRFLLVSLVAPHFHSRASEK